MVLAAVVVRSIFALYSMSTTIASDKHSDESWHAINPSFLNVEVGCQLGPLCVPDLDCDKSTVLVPRVFIEFFEVEEGLFACVFVSLTLWFQV